jgi:hypothetical protein
MVPMDSVDKALAVLEVEMLVDKDLAVSSVETLVVKDRAVLVVEMLVDKDLATSLEVTLVDKDQAVLVVEMLVDKDLATSSEVTLVDKDPVALDLVLELETHQVVMPMMVLMKVEIYLLFLVNQELIIQYYLKYQKLHLLVTKDCQVTMLTLKPDAKYSIFVQTILNMTLYAPMEQFSINNTSYVSGGISLIVRLPKVFTD